MVHFMKIRIFPKIILTLKKNLTKLYCSLIKEMEKKSNLLIEDEDEVYCFPFFEIFIVPDMFICIL